VTSFDAAAVFAILVLVATILVLLVTTYNAVVAMGQRIGHAVSASSSSSADGLPPYQTVRGLMGFERRAQESPPGPATGRPDRRRGAVAAATTLGSSTCWRW
jgi:hypothetical protein